MHEDPAEELVSAIELAMRAGETIEPISIGCEMADRFRTGPAGMEKTGHGYFLADGHHRLAAFLRVHGPDAQVDVLMRFFEQA